LKKIIIFIIVFIFSVCSAMSKRTNEYWIDKNVTVLAFIGSPVLSSSIPIRITTYEKQPIILLHKKSGRGIYAFYLKNLIVKGKHGRKHIIKKEGFFVVKKKLLSHSKFYPKASMKRKTKIKKKKGFNYDYGKFIIYPQL